jgi:VanZ like family
MPHNPGVMDLADTLPWLIPSVVVALVVSVVVSGPVGRSLRSHPIASFLLVFSFGVILAGTLSPVSGGGFPTADVRTCDLSRQWLATPSDLVLPNDVVINILMFMPFGFAVGMLPMSGRKIEVALAAMALPLAIEALQLLLVPLGRGCESADVVDNLTGLFIGLVGGLPVSFLSPPRMRRLSGGQQGREA